MSEQRESQSASPIDQSAFEAMVQRLQKVTVYDVLLMAIAESGLDEFASSNHKWSAMIEACQSEFPEFFDEILIDTTRRPYLWSDQVDQFLSRIHFSGIFPMHMPFGRTYLISSIQRLEIQSLYRPKFIQREKMTRRVAELMVEHLTVNSTN